MCLASSDVLQRQDGPVLVPLALSDGVDPLAGLGQGQDLHHGSLGYNYRHNKTQFSGQT